MIGQRRKPRSYQRRRKQNGGDGFSTLLTAQTVIVAAALIAVMAIKTLDSDSQLDMLIKKLMSESDSQLVNSQIEEFKGLFGGTTEVFSGFSYQSAAETTASQQKATESAAETGLPPAKEDKTTQADDLNLGEIVTARVSVAPNMPELHEGERFYLSAVPVWPVKGEVTSGFGSREHPILKTNDFHTGVDIAASYGSDIVAAFGGVVEAVGYDSTYGNYITVRQSESMLTRYCHCSEILAEEGDAIKTGQVLAKVGTSGLTTGAHLHFEVKIFSTNVNPMRILV